MKIFFLLLAISSVNFSFGQRELEKLESGIEKYYSYDFIGALEDFNLAIMINPYSIDAYFNRAMTLNSLENYMGANEDFSKAIKLDPENLILYWYRGKVKFNLSNASRVDQIDVHLKGAITDFTKAIELENKSLKSKSSNDNKNSYRIHSNDEYDIYSKVNVNYYRGQAKFYLKDYNGAIIDLTKVIDLAPESDFSSYYYRCRAEAKGKLKDYKGAFIDYSKAIELEPNNYSDYLEIAELKYMTKNFSGAIEFYSKAIELSPTESIFIYSLRAEAKNKMLDYRGAIAVYTKAIDNLLTESGELYLKRGDAKRLIKDKEGACLDYSKSGELGVKNAYERIKLYCN